MSKRLALINALDDKYTAEISAADAKKYGLTQNKKTGEFTDERWLTGRNLKTLEDPS